MLAICHNWQHRRVPGGIIIIVVTRVKMTSGRPTGGKDRMVPGSWRSVHPLIMARSVPASLCRPLSMLTSMGIRTACTFMALEIMEVGPHVITWRRSVVYSSAHFCPQHDAVLWL